MLANTIRFINNDTMKSPEYGSGARDKKNTEVAFWDAMNDGHQDAVPKDIIARYLADIEAEHHDEEQNLLDDQNLLEELHEDLETTLETLRILIEGGEAGHLYGEDDAQELYEVAQKFIKDKKKASAEFRPEITLRDH